MSGLLKALAIVCVVLLIITLPLALLAWDLGRVVFNPPLVNQIVTDEVVNSELIPLALAWFSKDVAYERAAEGVAMTGISEPDIVALISYLEQPEWSQIKQEVLPPEILAAWTSTTVDGVYAWVDNTDRVPQIVWAMEPFKARVNSEHGVNSITIAYNKLPTCLPAEIEDFKTRLAAAPAGTKVLYNLCQFPEPWHTDQFQQYVDSLTNVVENVPPQFALTQELAQTNDQQGVGPEALKTQLRQIRFWMNIAWLIPLVLLILIAALAVRSPETLARWWGLPLLVGGLAALLPLFVYRWLITSLLASGPLSETPPLIVTEVTRSILRLAGHVFQPMGLQAAICVLVGAGLLVFLFVRQRNKSA